MDFYILSSHTLSTFSSEDATRLDAAGTHRIVETLPIPVCTVNSIIEEHFDAPPDLVSIDVEGWNEQIIMSLDLTATRPFCFCVETVEFTEDGMPLKLDGISEFFLRNDYSLYADTHLNSIFIDEQAGK
jgi:hypothetical protein